MTVAVIHAEFRPLIEPHLPGWVEPRWFADKNEAFAEAPAAEIGWFDFYSAQSKHEAVRRATGLRWLNSVSAGVEGFPLALLAERGVVLTNGRGLLAAPIAEFVLMTMLVHAKDYRAVVRAQERREWLHDAPGKGELSGSAALILGYGSIGREIETRLVACGVAVTRARRTPGPGELGPDEWRGELGRFDWVILAAPATPDTEGLLGAAEIAALRPNAVVINVGRGSLIDQDALSAALAAGRIGGAVLDVTTPEPLPGDDALWGIDTVQVTMHLSGRSQSRLFARGAQRFLANLERYHRGEPLDWSVDLALGY